MPIEFRCPQCGKLLKTGDETAGRQAQCPACGALSTIPGAVGGTSAPPLAPLGAGLAPAAGPPVAGDSKAVVALVLGLAAMGGCCCPLIGFPIAIAGLVMGILSLKSVNRSFAVAGIVLSSVGLLLTLASSVLGVVIMLS